MMACWLNVMGRKQKYPGKTHAYQTVGNKSNQIQAASVKFLGLESSEASWDISSPVKGKLLHLVSSFTKKEAQNLEHLSEFWRKLILKVEYEAYHLPSTL